MLFNFALNRATGSTIRPPIGYQAMRNSNNLFGQKLHSCWCWENRSTRWIAWKEHVSKAESQTRLSPRAAPAGKPGGSKILFLPLQIRLITSMNLVSVFDNIFSRLFVYSKIRIIWINDLPHLFAITSVKIDIFNDFYFGFNQHFSTLLIQVYLFILTLT